MPLKIPEYDNKVWAYVPAGYDPGAAYGVVVWLHAPGGFEWKELLARWQPLCDRYDLILVAPKSSDPSRWVPGETALVDRLLAQVGTTYHVDPARIVVHGYEGGGAMAFLAAFHNREAIRAVAAVEAAPVGPPPENDPLHRLAVYLAWGREVACRPPDRASRGGAAADEDSGHGQEPRRDAALPQRRGAVATGAMDRHAGPDLRPMQPAHSVAGPVRTRSCGSQSAVMQKRILGIAAVVLLVGAVAVWLWWPGPDGETLLAFCWRAGALMAAAWLAYDDVQRLPGWLLVALPLLLVVLVRWPKLLLLLIPLLILCAALRRAGRQSP